MKYVRFKPDAARAFEGVPMFNQLCVYPVLSESEDDVLIEMHPACGENISAKLVVPRTMVDKMTEKLAELLPPGDTFGYSPQMIGCQLQTPGVWAPGYPRTEATRVVINSMTPSRVIKADLTAMIPTPLGTTTHWSMPSHWVIPVAETKSYQWPAAGPKANQPKKKAEPENKLLPKKDPSSIGEMVIVVYGDHKGMAMQINGWDQFRGRFSCYNGMQEIKVAQDEINILDKEYINARCAAALVTQSQGWLDRGKPRHGETGTLMDKTPVVMGVIRARTYGVLEVQAVVSSGGPSKYACTCTLDDVVPLTKEQLALFNKVKGGDGRDETWVRRVVPKPLARVIEVAPSSGFVPDLIAAELGITIPSRTTSAEIWKELVDQSKNIKLSDKEPVLLSLVTPVMAPAPVAPPVLERAVAADAVTLPPAADVD